jgi:hypothetical protein
MALVCKRTIPTQRQQPIGEVSANFSGQRVYRAVSVADPHGRNLDFLDLSRYSFFQVAP